MFDNTSILICVYLCIIVYKNLKKKRMSLELSIVNSQIVLGYARNINIRKRVFEFEEKLSNTFKTPFKVISIPDEVDPNIPRFETSSKHGFSKLQVSQHRINLSTTVNNFTKIEVSSYLKEKQDLLTDLARKESSEFIAYVIEFRCYPSEDKINTILKNNTGANVIDDELREFSISYSRLYKNNYFINVKCSKVIEEEIKVEKKTNKVIDRKQRLGISIILDINSKPLFYNTKKFDNLIYKKIHGVVFDVVNNKSLEDFLQGNI